MMSVDTIIIFLLIATAVISAFILLRSGRKKNIYDPNDVDLSDDYDPQHDHFSKEHVKHLKKRKANFSRENIVTSAAVAAKKREAKIHSSFEGVEHLKRSVEIGSQQSKGHKNRRESVDRRASDGRRHGERRSSQERRDKDD